MLTQDTKAFFSLALMDWYFGKEQRKLPWKASQNAYHIWLSEIILQQTRVEQGKPYYEKFIAAYPTIVELANASEDELMKLWEGLGYYSRARNLHFTTQFIRDHYDGIFPDNYEEIRALKGVGDYTAAAIASFAFDLPYSVVDGNVYRVLSRFFGIESPIDSSAGKKEFAQLAQSLLVASQAADYNQAIMDLGALVCKPKSPLCTTCPMRSSCVANREERIGFFPVKEKTLAKKNRFFYYFVWESPSGFSILHKRTEKDIWQGLYDFPLIELDKLVERTELSELWASETWQTWTAGSTYQIQADKIYGPFKQVLTHPNIVALFIRVEGPLPSFFMKNLSYVEVEPKNIKKFAVPKIVQQFLIQKQSSLF